MYNFSQNKINATITDQNLTISQSTRSPGDALESIHFTLTISGVTTDGNIPIDIRYLHQDWGNPAKAPIIGLQDSSATGLKFYVDQFVAFDHLQLIQSNVSDKTINSADIDYIGEKFPEKPANGLNKEPYFKSLCHNQSSNRLK